MSDAGVEQALREAVGDVQSLRRLTGGSSRQIWAFTSNGAELILRRDAPGESTPGAAKLEAEVMQAARRAALPVPEVRFVIDAADVTGLVMDRVEGATSPRDILRDEALSEARRGLARACGQALGRLHAASAPDGLPAEDRLVAYRDVLDRLGHDRPVLEYAYQWLVQHRPPSRPPVVVHGDFRLGNLVVGEDGLRAVLDWESAHTGDPLEDIGWLCVPAWRFRGPQPVGGFGEVADLLAGYREAGGPPIEEADVTWAIVLGAWVWAVGCLQQAERHLSGAQRSVDLAAVGRRVVENEADLLSLIAPLVGVELPTPAPRAVSARPTALPYGPPSLAELLDAVREFLEEDLLPSADERRRYQVQVSLHILRMAGRELAAGEVGVDPHEGLARSIRAGEGPPPDELLPRLAQRTAALLAVTNPGYLRQ